MKTSIDSNTCVACGICVDTCPGLYEMGETHAYVVVAEVPADLKACALVAEEACPVMAISHVD